MNTAQIIEEKARYRQYLLTVKPWICFASALSGTEIQASNVSAFMGGRDGALSVETLAEVKKCCERAGQAIIDASVGFHDAR